MIAPMAVSLASNHNNHNDFKNAIKRSPIASSSSAYHHFEDSRISERNVDIEDNDECSSLLQLSEIPKRISKEESRLIELTMNLNNNKPVLGKFPKSSSFDSSTTLTAQIESPKSTKIYMKSENPNSVNQFAESNVLYRNESESDNEYTLMLDKSYGVPSKSSTGASMDEEINSYKQSDFSNLQLNCNLISCSNHSLSNGTTPLLSSASPTNGIYVALRKSPRSLARVKTNCFFRIHTYLTRNSYMNYLVIFIALSVLLIGAYLTKDYAKRLFYWIETQNTWITLCLFMGFFILVSFPIVVGYFALIVSAGYLFGFLKGILTVVLGANLGVAIAHFTLRSLRKYFPTQKLIKSETARAILRVISGPRAFKVVLFTRLTPIPFGLQNAIFGISSINGRIYHVASFIGLMPAQFINVYLGSTLRSMQEVLSSNGTSVMGYISIGVEIICGAALMCWVVQKAKKELSETLISDINENKDIDIEV